jgi:hypothetical protein
VRRFDVELIVLFITEVTGMLEILFAKVNIFRYGNLLLWTSKRETSNNLIEQSIIDISHDSSNSLTKPSQLLAALFMS